MNKEIAEAWIAELRSGKHRQAKDHMRTESGALCCLGVLQCEVLKLPLELNSWLEPAAMNAAEMQGSDKGLLPVPVKGVRNLSTLNDRGFTFSEIADIIEEHWEAL